MKITEYWKDHVVWLDGGMGTLLQAKGLRAGELPERWNLTRAKAVSAIHRDYFNAGSNVVSTNTFGANRLKFSAVELDAIVSAAVANARAAARQSRGKQPKWVALDIGPTGRMLKPLGDLDFEDAVSIFAETVRLGVKYGVDMILIETMSDSYETKAALLAAKENSDLPVLVSNAYGADGKLMTGASPRAMVAMLEGMGADAIGVNCSLGPKALAPIVEEYLAYASVPVLVKPNAGMPKVVRDKTVYDVTAKDFAEEIKGADLLLINNETPSDVNERAVEIAAQHGVKVILNPAPLRAYNKDFLNNIHLFTPNEHEFAGLEDFQNVILTLGSKGCKIIRTGEVIPAVDIGTVVEFL